MITLPKLLNSSNAEVRRFHPMRLSISERIVPLSTAQMTVSTSETCPGRSYVELFTVCGSAGIYRTRTPQTQCGNPTVTINMEHAICEVGDWIITAEIEQVKKTISQALSQVFGYYRGSKWQLGTVSVSGNVVFEQRVGDNVLTAINSLIAQVPGSMMQFNFSTSPWTISVVPRGSTVTAEGRLSRNVTSAQVTKDESNLCTRVYVQGLGSGGAVGYRDADTISTYGVIEKYLSGSTYTAEQAGVVADQYLAQNKNPKYSIDIEIVDLHTITGESLDEIRIGKLFRLSVPDENITIQENIISISWPDCINTPNRANVTLSKDQESLVQFLKSATDDIYGSIGSTNDLMKKKDKEYWTKFTQTDTEIELVAGHSDTNGKILEKAGLSLNAQGAIVYAENHNPGDNFLQSKITDLSSQISVQADRISLVVTGSGNNKTINAASIVTAINAAGSSVTISAEHVGVDAATIVAAVNASGSSVTIDADKIDLHGHVSISDLSEYDGVKNDLEMSGGINCGFLAVGTPVAAATGTGWILCEELAAEEAYISSQLVLWNQNVGYIPYTINGTTYDLLYVPHV